MRPELTILSGPFAGQTISLTSKHFLIGREMDCQLRPASDLVSRHHCALLRDEYTLRIKDMGSKNGTFVNGQRVSGEVILSSNDVLTIGDMQARINLSAEPTAAGLNDTQATYLDNTALHGQAPASLGDSPASDTATHVIAPIRDEAPTAGGPSPGAAGR
jgi:pSer/pThr/pTyr-binding forkhead associated (FHA) protein